MILGIGTDIIEVARFKRWSDYSYDSLLKIFSEQELAACLRKNSGKITTYHSEKLAARFAAKEAFYKALSVALVNLKKTQRSFSFLSVARHIHVSEGEWGVPLLVVDWSVISHLIADELPTFSVQLSLAHEKEYAVAFVIISL